MDAQRIEEVVGWRDRGLLVVRVVCRRAVDKDDDRKTIFSSCWV
jgi:hypothetical protein